MNIRTSNNSEFSYLRSTNEIVSGIVDEPSFVWEFEPLEQFSVLPNLDMFIIGITEQCNLRCTYCCYSGSYEGNRTHSSKSMSTEDIDQTICFIRENAKGNKLHIAFYGGEPLVNYKVFQYAIAKAEEIWQEAVSFSVTTNGTLLDEERIEWLIGHHVELHLSVDGTKAFHDKHRVDAAGNGSYAKVYQALKYIREHHNDYMDHVQLQMPLPSFEDIPAIAESWHNDELLKDIRPSKISALSPNFGKGVSLLDFEQQKFFYSKLLSFYQAHPDWLVLKAFLFQQISYWKDRPIVEVDGKTPMSTCLPLTNKLFIDTHGKISVCEKFSDDYPIGDVTAGIKWNKANSLTRTYYNIRKERCASCPAVRMCDLCLSSVSFTHKQWDFLCHNERVHQQATFWLFCEMATSELLDEDKFPVIHSEHFTLDRINDNDVPQMTEIFKDEETKRYLPELTEAIREEDDVRFFLNNVRMSESTGEVILWGIRQESLLIGFIGIIGIPDYPSLFYAMHPNYRGKGIMTECVAKAIEWFHVNYPTLHLHTEVYKGNISSFHLLQKSNFTQFNEDEQKIFLEVKPVVEQSI